MAGTIGGMRSSQGARNDEQKDFRSLNDKLAQYVERVRQLGPGDSNNFLATLGSVQDEVSKLKRMYDEELDNLRRQLDDAKRDKNKADSDAEKMTRIASDLEDRCKAEAGKNAGLVGEINRMQNQVAALEKELANLKSSARVPETQLAATKDELRQAQARNQEMAAELDMEKENNRQLKDKVHNLEQKLDFDRQLCSEQLKDANARLDQSKDIIAKLEAKAKEMESQNASVPGLLASMRQKTDQDIQNYKNETEATHNKNVTALKQQIDSQAKALDQLRAALAKLHNENDTLLSKIRGLESQVRELKCQKGGLEDQLKNERARSLEQIRELEKKLKELQDLMFVKMQEANANRDIQVSLRAELEAYRLILAEEEKRLGCLTSSPAGTQYYTNQTSNYGMPSGFPASGSPRPRTNDKRYLYTDEEIKCGSDQAGQAGERKGSVAAPKKLGRYRDMTEYTDSYCRQETFRRAQNASGDGFPKIGTADSGSSRMYLTRSPDGRGNGAFGNSRGGSMRNSFPRVY